MSDRREAAGGVDSGELPAVVDDAMHAVFALPEAQQATAFHALLVRYPPHIGALTARWLTVVAADRKDPSPPTGLSRYRIDGTLGRGGMGEVFAAYDELLERQVALKVVRGSPHDPTVVQRCRREALVTARLEHPGIAPVHDLGVDGDGAAWFVMRRIDGTSAEALFTSAAADPAAQARALEVLRRICETLAFAHARGIVHRDLKPANVMLGAYGEVYVVDWGLARMPPAGGEAAATPTVGATMAGTIVGTPGFLAPERALAAMAAAADPRSDVYAVGAMLWQVLAGRVPYADAGDGDAMLAALRAGPPAPLGKRAPPALVAICERAMARAPADRYPDMTALAADLAAFASARVVQAHRTGAVVELVLWVRRNRALAAALAALALGTVVALVVVAVSFRDADQSRQRFRGLASVVQLDAARRRAAELHPPWPENLPALQAWSATFAEPLRLQHAALAAELGRLAARASPPAAGDTGLRFADVDDGILFTSLSRHAAELDAFFAPGGLAERMRERQAWATAVGPRSLVEPRAAWQAAAAAVAADARFHGFVLSPQVGLVPLGADRTSGFQEFADLRTGAPPQRDATGQLILADDVGIVFVLLPGGTAWIGAQPVDARANNHWPGAKPDEAPVTAVEIAPFLLAKHELTQAQWQRLAGYNPSLAIGVDTGRHPVGHVSWLEAERVLRQDGMTLPTEAQWEYACRAGAGSAWATGDTVASLRGAANVADVSSRDAFGPGFRCDVELDDGYAADAPVGSFAANAFGLCDMHGNHSEWCLDAYAAPRRPAVPGQPGALDGRTHRVHRGGSYATVADNLARCAYRGKAPADTTLHDLGLRAARLVR